MTYVDPLKGKMNINDDTMTKKNCAKPSRKHYLECCHVGRKHKEVNNKNFESNKTRKEEEEKDRR